MFKRAHTPRNKNFSGCMVTTSPKIFTIWLEEPRLSVMRNASEFDQCLIFVWLIL